MRLRFNVSSRTPVASRLPLTHLLSTRPRSTLSALLFRCHGAPQSACNARDFAVMAPKQATLGYVKSSQTTLGCDDT